MVKKAELPTPAYGPEQVARRRFPRPWSVEKGADRNSQVGISIVVVLRHWGLSGGDPYGASGDSRAQCSSRDGAVYGAPHSPLSDGEVAQGRHDGVWPTDGGCRTLIRRQAREPHRADFEHKTR